MKDSTGPHNRVSTLPFFQSPGISLAMFLRTRPDTGAFKEMLNQTVHGIDAELPVFGVRTMEELMSASMARRRFSLFLMSVVAGLALLLAAMGIYGLMAFVVGQRVHEFGIRAALGAQPGDILMLAFRPGLRPDGCGNCDRSGGLNRCHASDVEPPVRCLRQRSAYLCDCPSGARRRHPGGLFHPGEACHTRFPRRGAEKLIERREAARRLKPIGEPHQ